MFKVCPLNTMQETWQVILFSKQPLKKILIWFLHLRKKIAIYQGNDDTDNLWEIKFVII